MRLRALIFRSHLIAAGRVSGEIPERRAPVQLTAVYHHLLSRWAEI